MMSWAPNQPPKWQEQLRTRLFNTFSAYRRGLDLQDVDAPQQLPLQGAPLEVYFPHVRVMPQPFTLSERDKFNLDKHDDERWVPDEFKVPWRQARALRDHFVFQFPGLKYNKCLGWGGNGLAALFDDCDQLGNRIRSVVVKMVYSENASVAMKIETDNLRRYEGAEHLLQILYAPSPEKGQHEPNSSTEQPKLSCFITEMVENGDMAHFIAKVVVNKETIPNAILWRFLLCFVRMCTGLAYPPKSIQELKGHSAPVKEAIPTDPNVQPTRFVHFDFDPRNIFIGNLMADGEHYLSPLLKLGDFGLGQNVKGDRENIYYERLRQFGKFFYYAPEQFCADWDYIEPNDGLIQARKYPVAGNYGVHTNLWAVGLVMECLITLCQPRMPPTPSVVNHSGFEYYSYGGHLRDPAFSHVDPDLITLVMGLQAHYPINRPTLVDLDVERVIEMKGNCGKTDMELLEWMHRILYDVPPASSAMQGVQLTGAKTPLPEIIGAPIVNPGVDFQGRVSVRQRQLHSLHRVQSGSIHRLTDRHRHRHRH
ncbi:hypothetical protein F5Y09DRAFT_312356 [Xylaria sp. FL1042]|nr:hypothetical protein F5Y09DRAFT_312356 [Xylaria sp. FL1042]